MLTWFEVENFKSIKKLHLDFSPFMVFVGPNSVGKTNIIQALSLFLDVLDSGTTEPIEMYGGYEQFIRRQKGPARSGIRFVLRDQLDIDWFVKHRRDPSEGPWWMQIEITLRARGNSDETFIDREAIQLEEKGCTPFRLQWSEKEGLTIEEGNSGLIHDWVMSWFGLRSIEGIREVAKLRVEWAEPATMKFFDIATNLIRRLPAMMRYRFETSAIRSESNLGAQRHRGALGLDGVDLPLRIERMQQRKGSPDKFERVLASLQAVYPRIEDVSTIRLRPGRVALSFKERSIDDELGEANVSDGVMHALALLVALEGTPGSHVLAIEEPENALHPWALQTIIERAQEQLPRAEPLLLTTHSPVVVSAVKDPASLFIVENTEKQGTTVTPALRKEAALRAILANSGQTLGDVWLGGLLGGVPGAEL